MANIARTRENQAAAVDLAIDRHDLPARVVTHIRNTPLPSACLSNSLYASSACSSFQRWVNSASTSIFRSTQNVAHSAWMMLEKVQDASSVICRLSSMGLTSICTSPPSPTKHIVPPPLVLRIAFARASGLLDVSNVQSAKRPCVRSLIAATGSLEPGSTTSSAPKSFARCNRCGLMSSAITRAPIALANCVPASPTGPWPKIASVSFPDSRIRRSALYAVPEPQAIAAPAENDNSSGNGTIVLAGTHRYCACPPCELLPYTFTGTSWQSCCQPERQ